VSDLEARPTAIEGLVVLTAKRADDERGTVREFFRESTYEKLTPAPFARCVQVNVTQSRRGTIRGMHGEDTAKLVGVVAGDAFGVYVDARTGSPTYGQLVTCDLVVGIQVILPPGVLNGFQATAERGCVYVYGFDREWSPDMRTLAAYALDPDLSIPWPISIDAADRSLLSAKDAGLPPFSSLAN
jgi:dTDP-4-dehydrorhamnose 3,5-epimerase